MRYFLSICAAAAIVASPIAAPGDDFADACRRFASQIVFVGRVTAPPVRRHVPGQDQIERMRRKWSEADADMAKRKLWPAPIDVVVTPMRVETAVNNIEATDVYVRSERPDELKVGGSYLIYGHHEIGEIFPDIVTATTVVADPAPNGEVVGFAELARHFTGSVYGSLLLDDTPAVLLAGVAIRFTVGDHQIEAITDAAGRFIATGIPAGDISVEPRLPEGLSLDAPAPYIIAMPNGGCSELHLRSRRDPGVR